MNCHRSIASIIFFFAFLVLHGTVEAAQESSSAAYRKAFTEKARENIVLMRQCDPGFTNPQVFGDIIRQNIAKSVTTWGAVGVSPAELVTIENACNLKNAALWLQLMRASKSDRVKTDMAIAFA